MAAHERTGHVSWHLTWQFCLQQSAIIQILSSSNLRQISEQQLIHSILCVEDLETGIFFAHHHPVFEYALCAQWRRVCSYAGGGRLANWLTDGAQ